MRVNCFVKLISILFFSAMYFCSSAHANESNRWTTEEEREAFAKKVMSYESCDQCHKFSVQAWKKSSHFGSFESLNLDKEGKAKAIMGAMGLTGSPASQASCAQCHFTDQVSKGDNQFTNKNYGPTHGVSCESCHGPAADWVELHNKKSLKEIKDKFVTLTNDAQKDEYLKSVHLKTIDDPIQGDFTQWKNDIATKAGMIRPEMTYQLIKNCYECHSVDSKELINNTAGLDEPHVAGSEFEIVSWLSGEVKHNFQNTDPDNPKNKPFTIEEKRTLFIVGKILFTEHALMALSNADFPKSEEDKATRFYEEMKARAEIGFGEIKEINDALNGDVPELKTIMEKTSGFVTKLGDGTLSNADMSNSKFDGKTIVHFLSDMNKMFIKNSSGHTALSKLDADFIKDIEPKGITYK